MHKIHNLYSDQVGGSTEQARKFYNALNTQKTYLEFDSTCGTQFHCQLGAPLRRKNSQLAG